MGYSPEESQPQSPVAVRVERGPRGLETKRKGCRQAEALFWCVLYGRLGEEGSALRKDGALQNRPGVGLSHLAPNRQVLARCPLPFEGSREKRGRLRSSKVKSFRFYARQGRKTVHCVWARNHGSQLTHLALSSKQSALDPVLLPACRTHVAAAQPPLAPQGLPRGSRCRGATERGWGTGETLGTPDQGWGGWLFRAGQEGSLWSLVVEAGSGGEELQRSVLRSAS